ncbi:hypothetical protein MHM39_15005 [Phaeobacter sp. CNT1-3]|nr:hypothetical protein [Phaeobacter sp. CNT1-3]
MLTTYQTEIELDLPQGYLGEFSACFEVEFDTTRAGTEVFDVSFKSGCIGGLTINASMLNEIIKPLSFLTMKAIEDQVAESFLEEANAGDLAFQQVAA